MKFVMADKQLQDITRRLAKLKRSDGKDSVSRESHRIVEPEDKGVHRIRKRPARKTTVAQTVLFTQKFIRNDAVDFFVKALETPLRSWLLLLRQTTLPDHAPLTLTDVTTAFNSFESVIIVQRVTCQQDLDTFNFQCS